jgi:hypothetical protein
MAALKVTCSINLRKRDAANVPENQKSKSSCGNAGIGRDVLIASHKKRGRAPVHGEDPSLRFSHPSRDDFCRAVPEGVSKAFRNTSLQRNSSQVSTVANALRPFIC